MYLAEGQLKKEELLVFVDLVKLAKGLLITPTVSREWSLCIPFVITSTFVKKKDLLSYSVFLAEKGNPQYVEKEKISELS